MAQTVKPFSIINEAYFKAYSPIPENYDITELVPFFTVAEELWVKPVLGIALYEEILQQVIDNDVTELNSTLLLKVYPYLSFAICLEALPFVGYHFSQVGVTKGKSENSDSVSINDMNFISKTLRNQVELMKKYLKAFLDENAELFPKYRPSSEPCDCKCQKGDEAVWRLYFSPAFDKYDWDKYRLSCLIRKDMPNPYTQLYATPRRSVAVM